MNSHISAIVSACIFLFSLVSITEAKEISYGFEVNVTDGPLSPDYRTGTFTFDDSIVPIGGGFALGTELFTNFDFIWDGVSYDETTANTGSLHFDANGDILEAIFGSSCTSTGCGVHAGSDDWYFYIGDTATARNVFSYSVVGAVDIWENPASLTGIVPIPAAAWLFGSALLGLVGVARRKKTA